jgi:hypothetical protein
LRYAAPLFASINAAVLTRQIRWAMARFDVTDPVLWLYDPRHEELAGRFGEKLLCYFITDENADLPQNQRISRFIQACDDRLTKRADVVFGCSPWIVERRAMLNRNIYCIPNAADFDVFHRALDPGTTTPHDMLGLRRPIFAVVGGLDNRVDTALLRRIAEAYPNGSLVLVGPDRLPVDADKSRLQSMPNVRFVGQKPREMLPQYLKSIDVGIIPYVLRQDTLATYPLKLHEYLSAGRAVVSTAMPELRRFGSLASVADTTEEFIRMVGEAASDYAPERIEARIALAKQNTWDQRLVEIYDALDRHLLTPTIGTAQRLTSRSTGT